jgi:hypothetical protein
MITEYVSMQFCISFLTNYFSSAGTDDVDNTPRAVQKELPTAFPLTESVNVPGAFQTNDVNRGSAESPSRNDSHVLSDAPRVHLVAEIENNTDVETRLDGMGWEGSQYHRMPLMEYSHAELATDAIRVSRTSFDP